MARPRKEGLDYFPHDVDASNDEKIEIMEVLYGLPGYAFYFKMLERIYRAGGELSISDAEMTQVLAKYSKSTPEEFEKMLASSLKYGLFDEAAWRDHGILTSDGIKRRASTVKEKRQSERVRFESKHGKFGDEDEKIIPAPPSICGKNPPDTGVSAEFLEGFPSRESKAKEKEIKAKQSSEGPPAALFPENGGVPESILTAYRDNIGIPAMPVRTRIAGWLQEHGETNVLAAIKEAVVYNARNPVYIEKVLDNWRHNGRPVGK